MRSSRNWRNWVILLLAGCGLITLATPVALVGLGEFLVHADDLQSSGSVILLSGGGEERLDEAATLMRERYADLLVLTDTDRTMPGGLLEWEYVRLEMIGKGVSPAQIQATYHTVGSTADEASAVLEYLQRHKISSCIVVTDPFHTQRTRLIFNRVFSGSGIDVRVVPARGHWYRSSSWFFSLRGWQATFSEMVKLGLFFLGR